MTDIEITVSFVALLGGLLLANVANNMADALRTRRDLPIGFVPWAINFYISAAVINTFALFLQADGPQSYDMFTLAATLAIFMPYIMVSRLFIRTTESVGPRLRITTSPIENCCWV